MPTVEAEAFTLATHSACLLSKATMSLPFQTPHCEPLTNVAPDGATVGDPDDLAALIAVGNLVRSVIGTAWL